MKKNGEKSSNASTNKKINTSDHQDSKNNSLHSTKNDHTKILASVHDNGSSKKQVLTQKYKNAKNQRKKNDEHPIDSSQLKKDQPVYPKQQKQNKNSKAKELKQKLLKISNAKPNPSPENLQSNANSAQTMQKIKQNSSSISMKPNNDKIKLNQLKVLNQTKLLANTKSPEQLCAAVPLSKGQNQRLKLYFDHLYEIIKSSPKKATFQDVKNMSETINMTEWMVFCKSLGITEKIKGRGQGIHFLSAVFKKYEDIQRRLSYEKFSLAVREIILQLIDDQSTNLKKSTNSIENESQMIASNVKEDNKQNEKKDEGNEAEQERKNRIDEILDWLNLSDRKKHTKKLKEMGVMCSEEVYTIPKSTKKIKKPSQPIDPITTTTTRQRNTLLNSQSSSLNKTPDQSIPIHSATSTRKKLPKIYRTHQQRKQSKLMHNLGIVNLNKITPTQDTKDFLEKYIGYDDRYLKQYFNKQDTIKNGVMARLENNQKSKSKAREVR